MPGLITKKWKCKQMVCVTERRELSMIELRLWLTYSTCNNAREKRKKTTTKKINVCQLHNTCTLWKINWYHWMYDIIAGAHTDWCCYNQAELCVCVCVYLYIWECKFTFIGCFQCEDCTSLLTGVLSLFTCAKFAICMILTHSSFG